MRWTPTPKNIGSTPVRQTNNKTKGSEVMKKKKTVTRDEIKREFVKFYNQLVPLPERSRKDMKKCLKEYMFLAKDEGWIIIK